MLHMFFFLILFIPRLLCLSSQFVQGEVLVLITLKSRLASLHPHFTNTLTQPRARSELREPNMMRTVTFGACLAYCTIRGPDSDFWTFMHTVPASLESQHTTDLLLCSVSVTLPRHAYLDFMTVMILLLNSTEEKLSCPSAQRSEVSLCYRPAPLRVSRSSVSRSKALQHHGCLLSGGS